MGGSQGWTLWESFAVAVAFSAVGSLTCLSSWFICKALPLEEGRLLRPASAWAASALVAGGLWTGLVVAIATLLARWPRFSELPPQLPRTLPVLWVLAVLLYLASVGLNYALLAQERAREAERKNLESQLLTQEAELRALRAQLNPHFLFNALNSISALTSVDSKKAREMCVLLSEFLRRSLAMGERTSIALREELDLVRNYLAIEQIRFGARLAVDWDLAEAALPAQLPPLLLQPLAENAIKHGISGLTDGGRVRIAVKAAEGRVDIAVENPFDPDQPSKKGLGLGLRQVRQRLQGRFGHRAAVETRVHEGVHKVLLSFPLED
jgi:LytS/YehU family sensor histidine kinase